MKTFALLLFPAIISSLTSFAEESGPGIRAALQALPPHLATQVVRITADNGRPNPTRWYVLARNRREAGLFLRNPLYSITITDGQLSEAKRFVDARQIFNQRNFISIPRPPDRLERRLLNRQERPWCCWRAHAQCQLSTHSAREYRRSDLGDLGLRKIQSIPWGGKTFGQNRGGPINQAGPLFKTLNTRPQSLDIVRWNCGRRPVPESKHEPLGTGRSH